MRENNDINFLSKHKLMMCTMVILRFIMCIAFYICNWSLYEKCHTYYGMSGIPYKEGFVMTVLVALELLFLALSLESVYKFSTPETLKFYKHYRIVYATYVILMVSTYITLVSNSKLVVYFLLWGALFLASVLINIFISRKACFLTYRELNEWLKDYCVDIDDNQKSVLKKLKSENIKLLIFYVISFWVYKHIMSFTWLFIIYEWIYIAFLVWRYREVFKYYYPERYLEISLLNAVFCGAGALIVFLLNMKYLNIEIFQNRTLEELSVIQILFMIPFAIWASSKYRGYRCFEYMKLVDETDLSGKKKK